MLEARRGIPVGVDVARNGVLLRSPTVGFERILELPKVFDGSFGTTATTAETPCHDRHSPGAARDTGKGDYRSWYTERAHAASLLVI
ncbi:MAG: hypothetical protein WAK20_18885 [Candidatus Acidiferrum sp.]